MDKLLMAYSNKARQLVALVKHKTGFYIVVPAIRYQSEAFEKEKEAKTAFARACFSAGTPKDVKLDKKQAKNLYDVASKNAANPIVKERVALAFATTFVEPEIIETDANNQGVDNTGKDTSQVTSQ